MTRGAMVLALAFASACAAGPPRPAPLDTKNDVCAWCRMAISSSRTAGQIVAPGEEPRFFDDIGCLRDHLAAHKDLGGFTAFVADHRTGAWVEAGTATYTRAPGIETPMGSHLLAHADPASRDADPDARGGEPLTAAQAFGRAAQAEALR